MEFNYKGIARATKDLKRILDGEPKQNRERNSTPFSKYPEGSVFTRKKGTARFKVGKKQKKG